MPNHLITRYRHLPQRIRKVRVSNEFPSNPIKELQRVYQPRTRPTVSSLSPKLLEELVKKNYELLKMLSQEGHHSVDLIVAIDHSQATTASFDRLLKEMDYEVLGIPISRQSSHDPTSGQVSLTLSWEQQSSSHLDD